MQSNNRVLTPVIPPQTTYDYLGRVIELLNAPRRNTSGRITHDHSWIQHAEAIDQASNHCSPKSDLAVAYCTIGAVRAITLYDDQPDEAYKYVCSIIDAANPQVVVNAHGLQGGIPRVNDSHEFQRVINMLRKAQLLVSRWI